MTTISGVGAAALPGVRRARTGASRFHLADEPAAAESAMAAAPVGLPGLLALQEAESGAVQDREAHRHGSAVMDELASLQQALLGGRDDPAALDRLAQLARRAPSAADPRLEGVLRAVQVRAGIELARRSTAASG